MKPNFEEPLDTAKQLVEQNITLYHGLVVLFGMWKQFLLESPIPEYNILGENMIFANDWDHCLNITKHDVMGAAIHAQIVAGLYPTMLAIGR